ncbi:nitroreductase family deazaflavin-dependent oxidoreductase [Jidongwangia harbinensis]|uniref:nitroreductase family deazaflavin-dependent oxidoreductase n=1 Tax=Jidongwangia harbinensis TaxID=2878561 RepID=UPI001CDA17C1|nr:nitroreductase family deazaflavin-dependent oxidoreductase [Jidongwangia harbinensis]MCA2218932.1 nitroreductase family deazaflavin-dependent oxidoreductase [Jidongwangia harbinensis]
MTETDEVRRALDRQQTVEITTIGRRSGQPRRIETWRYRAGGRYWLTGSPGSRDWYANLVAHPRFTLHLTGLDLPVRGRVVTDQQERTRVFREIVPGLSWAGDVGTWIDGSPLVEIELA